MVETQKRKQRIMDEIIQKNREIAAIPVTSYNRDDIRKEKGKELHNLYKELKNTNKKIEFHQLIQSDKYMDYPDIDLVIQLSLEQYKIDGTIPNITYCGDSSMFNTDLILDTNKYIFLGEHPYTIMISNNKGDYKEASILATMETKFFLADQSDKYVNLILTTIENNTKQPINLILTDDKLKEIQFASIHNREFNWYGYEDRKYYDFFSKLYEDYLNNMIYIGESIKAYTQEDEIIKVQNELITASRPQIATENNMSLEQLEDFNDKVKKKILKIY